MVVFTCGHCGESVNKPKVEKHYLTKCRNRTPNLSCMDCFKDFLGNDYETHIKCITEEERYSGKGFQAKEKKGEKKQNAWVEMLQSVLDEQKTASKNVLRIIETISKHNNTPRKKPKFINFVKNVCGYKTNPKDIDEAWDLISVKLTVLSNNNTNKQNGNETSKLMPAINSNGIKDIKENGKSLEANGDLTHEILNDSEEIEKTKENLEENDASVNAVSKDKMTKKQRKEEKKRKKYEAELQSAATPDVQEDNSEDKNGELGKKLSESKSKNKKRKRQDTITAVEAQVEKLANIENEPLKIKEPKKKPKTYMENEPDQSLCLHDQNVANSELTEKNGKFNWHSVILSVLQKKDNEVPFKRLQKKVLAEYSEYTGEEIDDRIADKFIKKLKSAPNVRVDKNRVLLLVD